MDVPRKSARYLLVMDPRRYRRRVGRFVVGERVMLGETWTPFVRLRPLRARAADGGTEI